jgi:hypothetical protein
MRLKSIGSGCVAAPSGCCPQRGAEQAARGRGSCRIEKGKRNGHGDADISYEIQCRYEIWRP